MQTPRKTNRVFALLGLATLLAVVSFLTLHQRLQNDLRQLDNSGKVAVQTPAAHRDLSTHLASFKEAEDKHDIHSVSQDVDNWSKFKRSHPVIGQNKTPRYANHCPAGDRRGLFQAGEMDQLFHRLNASDEVRHLAPTVLSHDPWVIQFDSFLSLSECTAAIAEAGDSFTRDETIAAAGYSVSLYRNSSSFGCDGATCLQHPAIQGVRERMSEVLGASLVYGHGFNMLRYLPGGYYKRHHDFILEEADRRSFRNCGPRVLTFFVYLTDVDEGGETAFFHLGLNVQPKAGRAILFADTKADKPEEKDERTAHESVPLVKGTKVNGVQWFYQYEFETNKGLHCCRYT